MSTQKQSNVQTFNSAQFGELRTQVAENGKILFCLADVAKALEIANPRNIVQRLASDGVRTMDGVSITENQYGTKTEQVVQMTFIDEPNLYRCIFQSRKKEAEAFQSWVFEEVLPSIRKTGGYIATTEQDTPEMILAKALQVAAETIQRHEQKLLQAETIIDEQYAQLEEMDAELDALKPKADYAEKVLASRSTLNITQIAAEIGMSAVTLNKGLASMGIQRKVGGQWVLTARHLNRGYESVQTTYLPNGQTKNSTVWTQKGRAFILLLTKAVRVHKQDFHKAVSAAERLVAQMTDSELEEVQYEDAPWQCSHPDIF